MVNKQDITKANQIYLFHNLLNLAFYSYFILRIFNVADLRGLTEGVSLYIIIAIILVLNLLRVYAKKLGGIENPIRKMTRPKVLSFSASVLFMLGVMMSLMLDPRSIWISVLCVPAKAIAIILTLKTIGTDDNELLDDIFDDE
jgi:hypothetical protein